LTHSGKTMSTIHCKYFYPCATLRNYVKFYYLLEVTRDAKNASYQLVAPDGDFEINFNLGAPLRRRDDSGFERIQPNDYVIGRFNHFYHLQRTGEARLVGIRFFPWGIRSFIGCPVHELCDRIWSLEEVFGSGIQMLRGRIEEARSVQKMIHHIENYFLEQLQEQYQDDLVEDASKQILMRKGRIRMHELSAQYGLSLRRMQQRFFGHLGMNPKSLARLAMFQNALSYINRGIQCDYSEITYQCGYFDQAHFINDFKQFAGVTPKKYISGQFPLNTLISKSVFEI